MAQSCHIPNIFRYFGENWIQVSLISWPKLVRFQPPEPTFDPMGYLKTKAEIAQSQFDSLPDSEKQKIRALSETEAACRAKLRRLTGNMQIHEGIRVHPKYCIPGVHPNTDDQMLELIAFARDWPIEYGGLGAFGHFKRFARMTWPEVEWNEWLEAQIGSLCDSRYERRDGRVRLRFVNWVGAGAAGKTFAAGLFACAWFMFDPKKTSITLTSTSKGIIAQRVWPVIQRFWWEAQRQGQKWEWGHMLESQKMVQAQKGDAKHSICALAVERGDLQGSLDRIKGRHTPRMMLIVDEANSTPQAIFECIPNMLTAVEELIVLVIGNAGAKLDAHGQCCEPSDGWKSISIDSDRWATKGVAKWGIEPGICLRFDGEKSPNVRAGKTLHKNIYTYERWQAVLRHGPEYRNTLQHWSQDRGFWPPDGIETTIFSEALVQTHGGKDKIDWLTTPVPCGALDPAFGGDDCLLQFGFLGEARGGRKVLLLTEHKLVSFDPECADPLDYQIARSVIRECKLRGVEPNWFGLDATGIGRGVAAILQMEWSTAVQRVEFGGMATDRPASASDNRPSREVYANRVTELWYSARDLLISDQLKGLYDEAIKEACSRVYEFLSRRYKVEPKGDMKVRLGYSPDHMDAIVVLVDVVRNNGLVIGAASRMSGRRQSSWNSLASSLADVSNTNYTEDANFQQFVEVE